MARTAIDFDQLVGLLRGGPNIPLGVGLDVPKIGMTRWHLVMGLLAGGGIHLYNLVRKFQAGPQHLVFVECQAVWWSAFWKWIRDHLTAHGIQPVNLVGEQAGSPDKSILKGNRIHVGGTIT